MGLFEHFPYTNFHGLNLDWLLQEMKKVSATVEEMQQYIEGNLEPIIEEKLDEMVADGTFDEILARLMVIDYVTPEMYGATGDGITDDTVPFQAAVNSGRAVCLLQSKMYKLTDTIHLGSQHTEAVDRERVNRIIFQKSPTDYNSPSPAIVCEFADDSHPIFSVESKNWRFVNISIQCKNGPGDEAPDNLTLVKTNISDSADVDFALINCKIDRTECVCDLTGRGFLMTGCFTYSAHKIVDIKWAGDPGSGLYHDDTHGQRAITIENNRFHACKDGPMIHLASGANAFGLRFCNNNFDRGRGALLHAEGRPLNWNMSENTFTGMSGYSGGTAEGFMEFEQGLEAFIFSNNNLFQTFTSDGSFANVIYFAPGDYTAKGLVCSGNRVNTLNNGSLIYGKYNNSSYPCVTFQGCTVIGNVLDLLNTTGDAKRALVKVEQGTFENCVIASNCIGSKSGTADIFAVYCSGSHSITYSKIMANAIAGTTTTYGGTGTATLTGTLIDDDLYPNP